MAEVEVTREGGVQTIALNRPHVLNALNAATHEGLAAALEEARDPDVRAVVITGAGRGFCVGQDLTEFRESAGDIRERLRTTYHPNVLAIRALEKPVIAAVNGPAAGAGLSFACACDIRIAAVNEKREPLFTGASVERFHPVQLVVHDDLRRWRLTVALRALLALPHLLLVTAWQYVAFLVAVVNWFITLVRGRPATGLHAW